MKKKHLLWIEISFLAFYLIIVDYQKNNFFFWGSVNSIGRFPGASSVTIKLPAALNR